MIKLNQVKPDHPNAEKTRIHLRVPNANDGKALHRMVAECPPLDTNSVYCNLLQCTHFGATSVAAERDSELVGFISGYIVPNNPHAVFVWQVAVAPSARKCGLATRMLHELLARPACRDVELLHTTVTPDNKPSRALFTALASALGAPLQERVWFEREQHFNGAHGDEILLQIGPIKRSRPASVGAIQ